MVEVIPESSAESTTAAGTDEVAVGVVQVFRYGVQLASHVSRSGGAGASLDFQGVRLLPASATSGPVLEVDLVNEGDLAARTTAWVELYDEEGTRVARREGKAYLVYPGTAVRQRLDLSDVPAGTYEALVVMDTGSEDLTGAQYTLSL